MKNKGIVIAAVCLLVFGLGVLTFHQDRPLAANQTGVVTASSMLNVRTGAGTSYDILQKDGVNVQLASGTTVTIIETLTNWYKVKFTYDGSTLTGYVSASYIAIETTATATPVATTSSTVTYRTETTYKAIQVAATMTKSAKVYKKDGKTRDTISGKKITLASKQAVTITGETRIDEKKWFKVSFTYSKKTYSGYVRSSCVSMTLKKAAYAKVANVTKAIKVRAKAGMAASYKKSDGKVVSLSKGTAVSITKEVRDGTTKWYKLSYTYNKKSLTGYLKAKYVKLAKKAVTKKVAVTTMSDSEFEKYMTSEGFPDSYKKSLRTLHKQYPYWQFKAYKTGLDWSTALKAESKTGVNLISNAKGKAWKSTASDAYDSSTGKWKVFDGSTWVAASQTAVAYYMDPRNFLNDRCVYMFELLEYQSDYQTKDGVNTILSNTPFYKKKFSYTDSTGATKKMYYVTAFMKAAKTSKASPYHLASRVKQEVVTSATTTSTAVSGTVSGYKGIYNFYNIGATSSSTPVLNGLKWASNTTAGTYLRPWTDPYRSIVGGAQYISASYINKGQNSGYLEKFNVTNYRRYEHQYMTNVEAAYEEALKTKKAYDGIMDQSPLVFSIPVYENMPSTTCPMPS